MKKFICFSMFFFSVGLGYAKIVFRQATEKDLVPLLLCYQALNDDDQKKLVVFPELVRAKIIEASLKKGRYFVACDTENNNQIVSFLKLFVIDDRQELKSILHDELRCIGNETTLLTSGSYTIPRKDIFNFEYKLELDVHTQLCSKGKKTYVYYGGAYTHPDYRNQGSKNVLGVSTALQCFALNQLLPSITKHLKCNESKQLCYVYGQVEANAHNKAMIRIFASCIQNLFPMGEKQSLVIHHEAFLAYKPDFVIKDGELTPVFTQEGRGRGNVLTYVLKK